MKTREVKLGEVANVKGGKRIPKGIGLINIPNGHPYIRVRDLNNKRVLELDNSYEYVDNETQKVISKYTVKRQNMTNYYSSHVLSCRRVF